MTRLTLELAAGLTGITITQEQTGEYFGWRLMFDNGNCAFIRREDGEWVQQHTGQLKIHDLKTITEAIEDATCFDLNKYENQKTLLIWLTALLVLSAVIFITGWIILPKR